MKALLINGSPHEEGCTYTALSEVAKVLNANGVTTDLLYLGKSDIKGCRACGACKKTGKCIIDDAVNEVLDDLDNIDAVIVGSPVYYGGPNGAVCAFLDRLFYASRGRMAGKIGAAVVSCRRGGATEAFARLNMYFMMNNMPVATSQYWNQIHGNNAEQAKQDLEGLQTMRTLAQNIVWLLQSIDAGRKNNVKYPQYEPATPTNFIR
jgi:multimeric flavodoxin WrbA